MRTRLEIIKEGRRFEVRLNKKWNIKEIHISIQYTLEIKKELHSQICERIILTKTTLGL